MRRGVRALVAVLPLAGVLSAAALSVDEAATTAPAGASAVVPPCVDSTLVADGATAVYPLDDGPGSTTATDVTANGYAATVGSSVTYDNAPGPLACATGDGAMGFTGSSSSIATMPAGVNSAVDGSALTVIVWMKAASWSGTSGNPRVVTNAHTDSSDTGFQLEVQSSGASGFFDVGASGSGTAGAAPWTETLSTGTWYMYAGTYNGSTVTAYINGSSVGTGTTSGAIKAGSTNVTVGYSTADGNDGFDGQAADVAILPTALSASQISSLYSAGTTAEPSAPEPSCVDPTLAADGAAALYPLDDPSGAPGAADVSGNNNTATLTGSVNYDQTPGPLSCNTSDGAMAFPGGSYLTTPISATSSTVTGSALTVVSWVKASSWTYDGDNPRIVTNSHTDVSHAGFQLMMNDGGGSGFFDVGTANTSEARATWNTSLSTGQWYMYAGTYNGATATAYLNGQAVGSASATGAIAAGTTNVSIGESLAEGSDSFDGQIADVAILPSALSASQIASLYSAGTQTNGYGLCNYQGAIAASSPYADYLLNDTTATAANSAGAAPAGTISSSAGYDQTPGPLGCQTSQGALDFNGSSTKVDTNIPDGSSSPSAITGSALTVAAWFKASSFSSGNPRLVASSHIDDTSGAGGFEVVFTGASSGYFDVGTSGTTGGAKAAWSTTLSTGTWYYFVGTYNGSTITSYLDGAATGSASASGTVGQAAYPISIGYNPSYSGDWWSGDIADVAILPSALSAGQVAALYNGSTDGSPAAACGSWGNVTVPAGVTAANVNLVGGGGGSGSYGVGGGAASVTTTVSVTPGQVVSTDVGCGGGAGNSGSGTTSLPAGGSGYSSGGTGGYGGASTSSNNQAGGGGGSTGLCVGSASNCGSGDTLIVEAGGGGGGGSNAYCGVDVTAGDGGYGDLGVATTSGATSEFSGGAGTAAGAATSGTSGGGGGAGSISPGAGGTNAGNSALNGSPGGATNGSSAGGAGGNHSGDAEDAGGGGGGGGWYGGGGGAGSYCSGSSGGSAGGGGGAGASATLTSATSGTTFGLVVDQTAGCGNVQAQCATVVGGYGGLGQASGSAGTISIEWVAHATTLSVGALSSSYTAGASFSLSAGLTDYQGAAVAGDAVSLSLNSTCGGSLGGTTTATSSSSGLVSFSGLSVTKVCTGDTLTVTDTTDSVSTHSTSFAIVAAAAAQLAWTSSPASTSAGSTLNASGGGGLTVAVEDPYGNIETGNQTDSLTLSIGTNGGSPTPGTLSGAVTVTVVNGVATFATSGGPSINKVGTGYTLTATDTTSPDNTGAFVATSAGFAVTPGAESRLVFTTQPSNAAAGAAWASFSVAVEDASGNLETTGHPGSTDSISVSVASGSCVLSSGTNPVNASNGTATFSGMVSDTAGACALTATDATDGGVAQATSSGFTVAAGSATHLVVTAQPSPTMVAGGTLSLTVAVEDVFGNVETSGAPASDSLAAALDGGTFASGTTSVAADGAGVAEFSGLAVDQAGSFTVTVSDVTEPTVTAVTSSSFTVSPAAASQLAIVSGPPASGTAGVALGAGSVQVALEDPYGNAVTTGPQANDQWSVTVATGPAGGTISEGAGPTAAASGAASFTLTFDVAGTYTLSAVDQTDGSIDAAAASSPLAIDPAPATSAITSSVDPSSYDHAVILTDTVTGNDTLGAPTGTVGFSDTTGGGDAPIDSCGAAILTPSGTETATATCSYSPPVSGDLGGDFTVVATSSGDASYASSTSPAFTQVVGGAQYTTINLIFSAKPIAHGQSVTMTATVGDPTGAGVPSGTVDFYDVTGGADTLLCSEPAEPASASTSTASCEDTPVVGETTGGTFSFEDVYSGDFTYGMSVDHQTLEVLGTADSTLSTTSSTSTGQVTKALMLTATVAAAGDGPTPTGSVTFFIGGDPAECSTGSATRPLNASGQATCKWIPSAYGDYPVTFTYSGDTTYQAAGPSATFTQVVGGDIATTASAPVLTAPVPPARPEAGQAVTVATSVSAASGSTPTGSVTFSETEAGTTATLACSPATVDVTGRATCTFVPVAGPLGATVQVSAAYDGSSVDAPSPASAPLVIEVIGSEALSGFAVTSNLDPDPAGALVTFSATVTGTGATPTGTVSFFDNASPITCIASSAAPVKVVASETAGTAAATCREIPPGAGTHTITASYSGDVDYAPATTPSGLDQVASGATAVSTVAVTSSADPSSYGSSVTLAATVTGTTTVPGNWVSFSAKVGTTTTVICTQAPLTPTSGLSAEASCDYDPPAQGGTGQVASITAHYSGDATYAEATSKAFSQIESGEAAPATFTLAASANPLASGQVVVLSATLTAADGQATPTGTVSFFDDAGQISCATTSGGAAKLSAAGVATCKETPADSGTHTITASYSGDVTYAAEAAPSPLALLVDGTTAAAEVAVTSPADPSAYGSSVTLAATVTGTTTVPGNWVSFSAKVGTTTTVICTQAPLAPTSGLSAEASCDYDPPAQGGTGQVASITATYSGDATYAEATSKAFSQIESGEAAPATFTLAASANPLASGKVVVLSATLTAADGQATPTGTVSFFDDAGQISCATTSGGAAKLSAAGVATCKETPADSGTHTITASYSGDVTYAAEAAPSPLALLVDGTTAAAEVAVTSPADPSSYGSSVTLAATVTGTTTVPGNWVSFSAKVGTTTTVICTQSPLAPTTGLSAEASCDYDPTAQGGAGQVASITATYSGDATYAEATSKAFSQQQDGEETLAGFTLGASPNPSPSPGHLVTLTATLTGTGAAPTGTVVFSVDGTPITCTGAGSPGVKVLGTGTATCHYVPPASGTSTVTATYSGDVIYAAAPTPDSLDLEVL